MIGAIIPLLVAVPLVGGALLAMMRDNRPANAITMMTVLSGSLATSIFLVYHQVDNDVIAHQLAAWPFGIAIPFVADMFAALMLTVTGILAVTCAAFALASGHAQRPFFASFVLFLVAGVNGALLTADLFNFFVFLEVMLLPSYGLLILSAAGKASMGRVSGSRLYVTVNLLTSTVFLIGVAFLYGVTGTVNLAELAGAAQESTSAAIAAAICLFALAIKASVVPVHGWLARTYPSTSPAVTALFSGLHTKVAIYAIYRIYAVIFDGDATFLWVGVVMFSLTMIIGVMGAVGENTSRSILAFHMISQIGYILLGVALFGPIGLTAGIFYLLHHMIVKASLFLSTGAVEVKYGTGTLGKVGGIAKKEPWLAVAFFAAALSLAGLPPFSGFVAKLTLISAAIDSDQFLAAAAAILVSLVTLLSMLKIWSGMFWGKEKSEPELKSDGSLLTAVDTKPRVGIALLAPSLVLALITLSLGIGAELLLFLSEIAAMGLYDPTGYVQAVVNA